MQQDVQTQSQPQLAIFDPEDLVDRLMGSESLAKRIVACFLQDLPIQLLALSNAVNTANREATLTLAHTIKGTAANVSGLQLAHVSAEFENAVHQCDDVRTKALFSQLNTSAEETVAVLSKFAESPDEAEPAP